MLFGSGGGTPMPGSLIGGTGGASAGNPPGSRGKMGMRALSVPVGC
ncbi:hypothetical protein I551_2295 [Mycobacterium ulcerans str. Harvey]|uniref:Uncharacterized protein n=1 Tax=Mycobacterium ulcerans str. Harvey TaxID=1299332 RepID=A0ABN0R2B3_MYCUL|nr:hypothetical protein I551_2295 [Mycobacterium ulcerans str. Harvey]